jgi:hypothetical protein
LVHAAGGEEAAAMMGCVSGRIGFDKLSPNGEDYVTSARSIPFALNYYRRKSCSLGKTFDDKEFRSQGWVAGASPRYARRRASESN